jgi:hypothetical protein
MRFVVIDNCPVPAEIADQVKILKRAVPGAVLQSAYRGDAAAGLLKRLGKSTQAMLYNGWLRRLPASTRRTRPVARRTSCAPMASPIAGRSAARSAPGAAGSTSTTLLSRS